MEENFKKFMVPAFIFVLAILSFFVLKPILTPVVIGLVLAYLFNPLYNKLKLKIKSSYGSAAIILGLNLAVFVLPLIILIPMFTKQVFEFYLSVKDFDAYNLINTFFPSLLSSPQLSAELLATSSNLKATISQALLNFFKNTILNIPQMIFSSLILIFTFFFALIESDYFKRYFSIIFPFSKENEVKFYDKFEKITNSLLYGQFIVGIVQGLIAGVGYFMLGIPNALLLTVITMIVGIIPVIGPWLVWIPVDIYLFMSGMTEPAFGLLIFGLFVINWIDSILRPIIVSSRAEVNSAIALIGMIGGVMAFGVVGFILGPLIIAYFILLIEIHENKKEDSVILREKPPIP